MSCRVAGIKVRTFPVTGSVLSHIVQSSARNYLYIKNDLDNDLYIAIGGSAATAGQDLLEGKYLVLKPNDKWEPDGYPIEDIYLSALGTTTTGTVSVATDSSIILAVV